MMRGRIVSRRGPSGRDQLREAPFLILYNKNISIEHNSMFASFIQTERVQTILEELFTSYIVQAAPNTTSGLSVSRTVKKN